MGLPRNEEYVYYIEEPNNRTIYTPITGNPDEEASPTETSNVSSDQSTGKTIPSINWDADNVTPVGEGSNGDEGVTPPSYPNVNPDPVPVIRYKSVTRITRVAVEDFSHSALEALHNQGVTFVVIYTDGTEDDVDWTEVYDPQVITTSSITFDADNIGAASNQHFWDDTNGAHVTDNEQDDWNTEYAKAGHGDLANPTDLEPWHNILMNSLGILLRRGLVNLVSFSKSAIAFYDGSGNQNGNITAFFGRNNAQIGRDTEKHLVLNSSGITVYNGDGTVAPLQASNISAAEANIQQLQADTADISTIRANSAKVSNLTANQLNAASGYIESLTTSNVSANDISANKATIASLISGNVTVNTLRAASAFIASLISSNIGASNIVADHADISDLKATKVNVSDLEADYITANTIESTYMKADISNADVAWIQNGVIKDGSISNAMIASVSANKLTAGTIDASNITVTNLNADNITTGTINGQRIGEGSLSLSKLEDDVYTEAEVDAKLSNMQTQIDGAIETWTGTAVPTLNNTPANTWTDTATKHNHVGDVYFVVNSSSQQNGYNYRFTESGTYPNTTYSWQLIKDNDVTNALSRLTTAEGKIGTIEQFDSDISSWKTSTDEEISSIKSNHTTLAGRVETAEGTLATKVDTTSFNSLQQTVSGNSSSIQQLTNETTLLTEKVTLEAPYTQVEWVEFTGQQICRLDWRPGVNGAFGFEADFITYNAFNSSGYATVANTREENVTHPGVIFGVRGNGASVASNYGPSYTYYALQTYTGGGYVYSGGYRTNAQLYTDGRRQQCSLRNGVYTAPDGSSVTVGTPAYQPSNGYMYVSGLYSAAGTSKLKFEGPSTTRIYSLKFYDGNELAVNLIPAIRKSDGVSGLYDSIEKIFYPSYGLLAGDDVGDLGDIPGLLNRIAASNPTLNDLRTRNSRLIIVESNDIKKLQDGQRLTVLLKYATASETFEAAGITNTLPNPAAANTVFLAIRDSSGNLIGGMEHPVYYNISTGLTTHYGAGMMLQLQFRMNTVVGSTVAGRGWYCDSDYNTNTNDTARYVQWYNNIFAKKALRNASIIVGDEDGYEEIGNDVTFNISYPILWRTANLAINKTDYQYSWTLTYDRNLATCYPNVSGSPNQILYLVGELSGGLFTIKTPLLTFTEPTAVDNLYYIPIGKLGNQSTGQNYLIFSTSPNPTLFAYVGNAFQQVQGLVVRTTNKVNEVSDTVDGHTQRIGSLETTIVSKADGSSLETVSNRLNDVSDTVDGHTQSISSINSTLSSKADGSTVSSLTTRVNNISDTVDGHTSSLSSITSTQTTIQQNAVKSTVQLWFTKANTTAPNKPTAHVTTNNSATGNAWNLAVPTYNASYPNYYYCYEYEYLNGSYGWSAVTRDIATEEAQERARTAITNAATADTKAENAATAASNAQSDIDNLEIGGRNLLLGTGVAYEKTIAYGNPYPVSELIPTLNTDDILTISFEAKASEDRWIDLYWTTTAKSTGGTSYNNTRNFYEAFQLTTEWQRYSYTDEAGLNIADVHGLRFRQSTARHGTSSAGVTVYMRYVKLERGNKVTAWTPAPEDIDADISTAQTAADNAQATADKNVKESIQLWITKATNTSPAKPTSAITSTATTGNTWTTVVPIYNDTYPHYFYCMQYKLADNSYIWSDVVYDQATTEAQSVARTTSSNLTTLQNDYATFKQTTQNFESTIGSTYATKTELSTTQTTLQGNIDGIKVGGANLIVHNKTTPGRLDASGNLVLTGEGAQHAHTEKIPVKPNTSYILSWFYTPTYSTSYLYVSWIDSNDAQISRTEFSNIYNVAPSNYKFTSPETAAYAIVSIPLVLNVRCATKFEQGTIPTALTLSEEDSVCPPNMLRGTNQPDILSEYGGLGRWTDGLWRIGSGTAASGSAEIFEIDDFTDKRQRYGFRVWSTTTGNKDIAQDNVPYKPNVEYRIIGYVRLTKGSGQTTATLQFRLYASSAVKTYTTAITSEEWTLFSYRFSLTEAQAATPMATMFGVKGKGSFEYCALYIKEGPVAYRISIGDDILPWQPALEDYASYGQTGNKIAAIEERVTTAETSITQTNESIALKANASDVYTKTQTDGLISTEVSNRNTAIEQSASAIQLSVSETYSTKNDTSQMTKPNLSPYFSYSLGNLYNATTNPNGYWLYYSSMDNWTNLSDGWAHVEVTAGSSTAYANYYVNNIPDWLKPSTQYTYMVEWRNVNTTNLDAYIAVATDYATQADAFGGGTVYTNITTSEGFTYLTVTSLSDLSNAVIFSRGYAGIRANSTLIGDFRISLYEGTYAGLYKPYVDQSLTNRVNTAEATLTVQAGQISSKVSADGVISSINQSAESVKIQASKVEIDGTAIFNSISSSVDSAIDGAITSAVNDISVGGRNLLKGTSSIPTGTRVQNINTSCSDAYGWYSYSTRMAITATEDGVKYTHNNTTTRDGIVLYLVDEDACVGGEDLVLSCEYRSSTAGWYTPYLLTTELPNVQDDVSMTAVVSTEEWQKGEWKINFPSTEGQTTRAFLFAYTNVKNAWIEIKKNTLKLEKGNKATAWSPAQEDALYQMDISNVVVSVYPVTIDWNANTATLGVRCIRNGQVVTPTGYSWTRDSLTTVLGSSATLNVTDLDAVYNCTVTFNV